MLASALRQQRPAHADRIENLMLLLLLFLMANSI
jgi:hypothetical protein